MSDFVPFGPYDYRGGSRINPYEVEKKVEDREEVREERTDHGSTQDVT